MIEKEFVGDLKKMYGERKVRCVEADYGIAVKEQSDIHAHISPKWKAGLK